MSFTEPGQVIVLRGQPVEAVLTERQLPLIGFYPQADCYVAVWRVCENLL